MTIGVKMRTKITDGYERFKEYLSSDVVPFELLKKVLFPIFWEQLFLACLALFSIWLLSFDGENAMSVVGMMSVANRVFTSLCLGMVTGGAVLVAQNIGAKKKADAGRCMFQTMGAVVLMTAVLGTLLILVRQPLANYLLPGADSIIVDGALRYFTGFCISFPFFAFYQSFAGAMRGWGRSNMAWRLTLSVNGVELALIAILLIGFKMGVTGVTLALVLSRVFGALYAAILIANCRKELELKPLSSLAPNPVILKSMLIIAVPLALEQFFFNSGKAVSLRYIAGFGAAHMAANGVVDSVFNIFNLPQIAFREALVVIVGMCVGCGQYDLARRYVYRFMLVIRRLLLWLMPLTIPLGAALVYSFRLPAQSTILALASLTIIYVSGPFLLAGSLTIPAALRGGGDAAFVSLAALGCMWGVRVTASWLFASVLGLGVIGINFAMVLDWFVRNIVFRKRLKGEAWYSRKLIASEAIEVI